MDFPGVRCGLMGLDGAQWGLMRFGEVYGV